MNDYYITLDFRYVIPGIMFIIVLALAFSLNRRSKREKIDFEKKVLAHVVDAINIESSSEQNLLRTLSVFKIVLDANSYGLYLLDKKSGTYTLKTVMHTVIEEDNIEPSYAGLLSYKKEVFFMPSKFTEENSADEVCIKALGKVPLIHIPLGDRVGIIVIGPIPKLSRKLKNKLEIAKVAVEKAIRVILYNEELSNKAKVAVSSGKAVKNISNIFTDYDSMLSRIVSLTAKSIKASQAFFINQIGDTYSIEATFEIDDKTCSYLNSDLDFHRLIYNFMDKKKLMLLSQEDSEFYQIPQYLVVEGTEDLIFVDVENNRGKGIAVFLYNEEPALEEYQMTALQILSTKMGELIDNQLKFKELSYSYIEMLKMLARLIDSLEASTVGYSEQMWGYAVIIGKELGLEPEKIKNIAIAAYLSNIGIIGISDDLLNEKGKYTEIQFEMMKLHVEVGASIIEATLGNSEVASYIRYHHEREDGYGYPSGLKGDEIPIGSKIISVIQTFLAKIQSRKYRVSLPFDEAIRQLKDTAGTQHDAVIIEALTSWFEKKQRENILSGTSLGRCWEMRCCSENICMDCKAYKNIGINCWEAPSNHCESHGNDCESCFIYSEYMSRLKLTHE